MIIFIFIQFKRSLSISIYYKIIGYIPSNMQYILEPIWYLIVYASPYPNSKSNFCSEQAFSG